MSIYIVTHKKFNPPVLDAYIPIHVGKCQTHAELGYLSDENGESIAEKNSTYCELTALFWMWKNCTDDVIGLCHYRRYFTQNPFSINAKYYLPFEKAEKLLEKFDVILPEKIHLKNTVQEKYSLSGAGFQKDLDAVKRIIESTYPEYSASYSKVMNGREEYFWNMFVMRKSLLDQYCEWLFDILERLETVTDLTAYDNRQKRIYGYISERLLNVWIEKNKLSIYECPVVQSDKPLKDVVKTNIGIKLKHRKL